MIVEGYSADVYCDDPKHYADTERYTPADVFTGLNKRYCNRQRRLAGWIRIKGKDICPACQKRNTRGVQ